MSKNANVFSLQLTLNFNNAPAGLKAHLEQIAATADGVEVQGPDQAEFKLECGAQESAKAKMQRRDLNRYVVIAAGCRGVSPAGMWVILYHHVAKKFGKHPVAESIRRGLPTHLDALFEIEGAADDALLYLAEQIEKSTCVTNE